MAVEHHPAPRHPRHPRHPGDRRPTPADESHATDGGFNREISTWLNNDIMYGFHNNGGVQLGKWGKPMVNIGLIMVNDG